MALKSFKLNQEYEKKAKELNMNMNQYVAHLIKLVDTNKTRHEERNQLKVEKLEGIVQSMLNADVSQRARQKNLEISLEAINQSNILLKKVILEKFYVLDELEKELSK